MRLGPRFRWRARPWATTSGSLLMLLPCTLSLPKCSACGSMCLACCTCAGGAAGRCGRGRRGAVKLHCHHHRPHGGAHRGRRRLHRAGRLQQQHLPRVRDAARPSTCERTNPACWGILVSHAHVVSGLLKLLASSRSGGWFLSPIKTSAVLPCLILPLLPCLFASPLQPDRPFVGCKGS